VPSAGFVPCSPWPPVLSEDGWGCPQLGLAPGFAPLVPGRMAPLSGASGRGGPGAARLISLQVGPETQIPALALLVVVGRLARKGAPIERSFEPGAAGPLGTPFLPEPALHCAMASAFVDRSFGRLASHPAGPRPWSPRLLAPMILFNNTAAAAGDGSGAI